MFISMLCKKCSQERAPEEFYGEDYSSCKYCAISRSKAWYQKNKEHRKKYLKEYKKRNRKRLLEKNRQYVVDNP